MRLAFLLTILLIATGCRPMELQTPEVLVRPDSVGIGGRFTVRMYGTTIAAYRFMGAKQEPDMSWLLRVDPVKFGLFTSPTELRLKVGDTLPLGHDPSVLVEFLEIEPSRLSLRALSIYKTNGR